MTNNLNTLLSNLSNTFDLINDAFKKNADPVLTNYSITEMHCIEHIKKIKNPNVTKLSASLRITRGGVCKIIKRLCAKSAVSPYRLDENKKEIYYTLTETGEKYSLLMKKSIKNGLKKIRIF